MAQAFTMAHIASPGSDDHVEEQTEGQPPRQHDDRSQLSDILGRISIQSPGTQSVPEVLQMGSGSMWHCDEESTSSSADVQQLITGESSEIVQDLHVEGDDRSGQGIVIHEHPDFERESASVQVASQLQQDLHFAAEEQRRSDGAEQGSAEHPASLQLERSPLFRTEEWQPRDGASSTACPICLLEFEVSEMVTTIFRCSHHFHLPCLRRWMEAPPFSCPVCRADASELQAAPAFPVGVGAQRHGRQPMPKAALQVSTGAARTTAVRPRVMSSRTTAVAKAPVVRSGLRIPGGKGTDPDGSVFLIGGFGQPAPCRPGMSRYPRTQGTVAGQGSPTQAIPRVDPKSHMCRRSPE